MSGSSTPWRPGRAQNAPEGAGLDCPLAIKGALDVEFVDMGA